MLCQWETETANKLILLTSSSRLRLLTERTVGVKKCFYKYRRASVLSNGREFSLGLLRSLFHNWHILIVVDFVDWVHLVLCCD